MLILGLQKTTLLDYPHHVASTIFTGGCNFKCPYCHNGDLVLNPSAVDSYTVDEIIHHLEKKKKVLDGVCISGGEPTLQSDLYSFISDVKRLNLLVKLDTNGTNPSLVSKLIEDSLIDYVAMDIKHCKEKYNQIACMNNFDISLIQASIDLLIHSNINYEFRTTVAKELHTIDDMNRVGEWLKGAKAYYIQPYIESPNVINPIFSSYSKDCLLDILNVIKPNIPNVELRGID